MDAGARRRRRLPSTFAVPVTDIAVDPNDSTGASIYITFGGMLNDARRVWRYNGSTWASASGTGATGLLDVQFGAVACDPDNPTHVYAGADIGVAEHELGRHVAGVLRGLPDVFVMDLKTVKLSHGVRVLRASTHGRGSSSAHSTRLRRNRALRSCTQLDEAGSHDQRATRPRRPGRDRAALARAGHQGRHPGRDGQLPFALGST